MTSLMMIEKDYLVKASFNVLIARRKKMFSKVFARTTQKGLQTLKKRYPRFVKLESSNGDNRYVTLDLDGIWQKDFSDESFPQIKRRFFIQALFKTEDIELSPQIRITYNLRMGWRNVFKALDTFCNVAARIFSKFEGRVFKPEEFDDELNHFFKDKEKSKRITKYILDAFSEHPYGKRSYDSAPFLQRRNNGEGYNVIGSCTGVFGSMKRCFSNVFEKKKNSEKTGTTYKKFESIYHTTAVNLGSILELMGLAGYETRGGDNPMIFIRLNDPYRIKRDGDSSNYRNSVISKQERHHETSCRIFDQFFMNYMDNDARWNFIEDFFLGVSEEELLEKYPATHRNHVNIVEYIAGQGENVSDKPIENQETSRTLSDFPPIDNSTYYADRLLTINGFTKKIEKWLTDDPVSLDKVMMKHNIRLPKDLYEILMSKLIKYHYPYYRDTRRLQVYIYNYPKQTGPVLAIRMYSENPVVFYKWWKTHRDVISMNSQELISLLEKVNRDHPKLIVKMDKDILLGKKKHY